MPLGAGAPDRSTARRDASILPGPPPSRSSGPPPCPRCPGPVAPPSRRGFGAGRRRARSTRCVNLRGLRGPPADPPPVAEPVTVAAAGARRGAPRRAVPGRAARPARRPRPRAPRPRRRLDRRHRGRRPRRRRRRPAAAGAARHPAATRAAGQAARLRPARGRGARGACWCSSTPTWCWPRTPSRRRSRCCAAPGSTCSRRGRASSPTAPRPGWCSRCCSGRGWCRCRCAGPSGRRSPSLCAANGQFLVVDAAALARAGGFAGVAAEVLDDIALARAVKRAGGRVGVADGSRPRGLPDVRRLGGPARRVPQVAVGGVRARAGVRGRRARRWRWPTSCRPLAALRGSRAGLVGYGAAVVSRVLAAAAQRRPGLARRAGPPGVGRGAAGAAGVVVARAPAGGADLEGPAARGGPAPTSGG